MTRDHPIPDRDWATIVRHVPIVSVDLVVRADGGVVLGRRRNEPARGEWFVPGGRLRKGESLRDAVHRVAAAELDVAVTIDRRLGVYEHRYDVADVPDAGGKHYVPVAYEVTADATDFRPDDQHDEFRVVTDPIGSLALHPYVEDYLRDAGLPE